MALVKEFEEQGNFLFRYRSYLPIMLLVPALIVYGWHIYTGGPGEDFRGTNAHYFIAILICLFGLLIRIFIVGFTPKNTSGRNTTAQVADTLNTTGIYSLVRHPLYVGNFFMWLGIAFLTYNLWFILLFILAFWLFYERVMFAEEQFLIRKFGDKYLNWAKNTPAFIPKLAGMQTPELTFSWKKVLKKEKNGFAAIFIVLFIFESIKVYIEEGSWLTDKNWLIFITAFSVVFYLILKYLKKYTQVFTEANR